MAASECNSCNAIGAQWSSFARSLARARVNCEKDFRSWPLVVRVRLPVPICCSHKFPFDSNTRQGGSWRRYTIVRTVRCMCNVNKIGVDVNVPDATRSHKTEKWKFSGSHAATQEICKIMHLIVVCFGNYLIYSIGLQRSALAVANIRMH